MFVANHSPGSRRTELRVTVAWIFVFFMYGHLLSAQDTETTETADTSKSTGEGLCVPVKSPSDSERTGGKKLPSRDTWEYIASAPSWVAASMLILTLKIVSAGLKYAVSWGGLVYRIAVSRDGTRLLYPSYSSRTGPGIVFKKIGLVNENSELTLKASYGAYHRSRIAASFDSMILGPGTFAAVEGEFFHMPDERFYGIGNATDESDESYYSLRTIESALRLTGRFSPGAFAYMRFSVRHFRTVSSVRRSDLELLFPGTPGIPAGFFLGELGSGLYLDNTDYSDRPVNGTVALAGGGISHEIGGHGSEGERFGFWSMEADIKRFFKLPVGPYRVVVVRGNLAIKEPLATAGIPFFLLSALDSSSSTLIHGYRRSRFLDRHRISAGMDYRFPIWTHIKYAADMVVSFDAGRVDENIFTDFRFPGLHYGFGVGIRYYSGNDSFMFTGIGWSPEEVRFTFLLR